MEDQKIYKNVKLDSPSITGKVTGEYQSTQEDWRSPTLLNSWVNYEASETTYNYAGFMIDSHGFVHLKGLVKSGTPGSTSVIFTLPKGYCPLKEWIFPAIANDAIAEVRIKPTGSVVAYQGSGTWFCLDGITFRTK